MKQHHNLTLSQAKVLFTNTLRTRPNQTFVVEWKVNGLVQNISGKAGKVKAGRYLELIKRLEDKGSMVKAGIPDRDAYNRLVFEQNDGSKNPLRRFARGEGFVSTFKDGDEFKVRIRAIEYSPREQEEGRRDYNELKKEYPFTSKVKQLETSASTGTVITTNTEPAVYDTNIGRLEVVYPNRKKAA
jgi:hypothetical protein